MRKKEWQNLHSELTALNEEFKNNNAIKQHTKDRKLKKDIEERLAYIMQLAFARITANEKAYKLLIADHEKNDELIENVLSQLADEAVFSSAIAGYLEKVKKKFKLYYKNSHTSIILRQAQDDSVTVLL
jgi:uncharacterized protein YwqG